MALPVLNLAQMRAWENDTWASGQTEMRVIERVGQALAEQVISLTNENDPVLILAGRGHNGDDARAALPHLSTRRCVCLNIAEPTAQLAELRVALTHRPKLIVDALFGVGLSRPLDEAWQSFVAEINSANRPVLAVDVPSGLDVETGQPSGAAVRAARTLTIGAPKMGLLKPTAWPYIGRLEVTPEVGLLPCPPFDCELRWIEASDFLDFPPPRGVAEHKGSFGHLAIVAGSEGFHGAAVLATHSAQRAQPGLVTLHALPEAYWPIAAQLQGAMVRPWSAETTLTKNFSAVLVGPGLATTQAAEAMSMITRKLWRDLTCPLVVDASALDWLPSDPVPKGVIRVITPHPGEAARLLKTTAERIQENRTEALREISRRFSDCWVVLKGHQTLIGRSRGEIAVNSSGNPQLAQGGTGDALAGYLAGLLAQPRLQAEPERTLRFAVWQHGATADKLSANRRNWVVEELVSELGNAG